MPPKADPYTTPAQRRIDTFLWIFSVVVAASMSSSSPRTKPRSYAPSQSHNVSSSSPTGASQRELSCSRASCIVNVGRKHRGGDKSLVGQQRHRNSRCGNYFLRARGELVVFGTRIRRVWVARLTATTTGSDDVFFSAGSDATGAFTVSIKSSATTNCLGQQHHRRGRKCDDSQRRWQQRS